MEPGSELQDRLLEILSEAVPELEARHGQLIDAYGEDLGPLLVLNDLAEFVAGLLLAPSGDHDGLLRRCFDALEEMVSQEVSSEESDDLDAVVAYGFFDGLATDTLSLAQPWLGPRSAALLEALEAGELDPDADLEIDDLETDDLETDGADPLDTGPPDVGSALRPATGRSGPLPPP